SPGTTMTCAPGTSSITVSATNNNFGYGSSADLQIVVTDFAVDVSPPVTTLAAGANSTHTVTVTPQNGAYNTEITFNCSSGNLPPHTPCGSAPPPVTPGRNAVRSTLTVTTTARSAAATSASAAGRVAPKADTPLAAGSGLALFPGTVAFGTQTIATTSPPQFV